MASAPILCYVTERRTLPSPEPSALLARIRLAIVAGVDWIQIREKDLPGRVLAELVRRAIAAAQGSSTRVIVNDRLDVAMAARAAGVHLGGQSLPVAEVVRFVGAGLQNGPARQSFLIGASCHSLAEAQAAERDGAHYSFFGPVFETPSKRKYGPPQGLGRLEELCRTVRIPILAIGGITLENAADCLRAGAAGLAAIRLFQESQDLSELVRKLRALPTRR